MNKLTRKLGFSMTSLLPALLPALLASGYGPLAKAQDAEPAIYACKQCVKYTGWRGTFDFGLGYVSEDSLRFGDYRGLEEEGTYNELGGDLHFRNLTGWYFDLYSVNAGSSTRQLDMRGGKQDRFELRFGTQKIPKYRGYGTQTPFLDVGSDTLSLPADWVYAPSTNQMTALQSSLAAAELKTERETMDAGGTLHLGRHLSFRIDYQRQEKKGTRHMGGGLFNSTILPAPVDFTTDIVDTALSFASKRVQLQVGFLSSKFENGNTSLTWRNPFGSRPNNYYIRTALEPGNEFTQFNVSGALVITPRIRLSAQASSGELTQDDPFIPYSTSPSFDDLVLPRESLDGKLETSTTNVAGKLFARLNNRLSFTARGKWDERENKTPVDLYEPVAVDLLQWDDRYNRPYSYEREQYSADLRLRVASSVRVSGGALQKNIERTLQAAERSEETTFWGEIKANPTLSSQVRFKVDSAQREVDDYLQPDDGGPVDHPLMRKFNQADRDRDRVTIDLDLMPTDAFGINLSYFSAQADYTESVLGLQESEEDSITVNLNYAFGSKGNMYAFLTRDNIDADLLNASSESAVPWRAMTSDEITTIGFGLSGQINKKISLGLDYVFSDSSGDISVLTGNEDTPFSPLRTNLANARLHFDHEISEHWGYKLYAEYESYESEDWAIDGLGVDGIGSVLTMGEDSPNYRVWYFRVQASYRF